MKRLMVFTFLLCLPVSAWAQTPIGTYITADSAANATLVSANAALVAAQTAQTTAATNKQQTDQQLSSALAQLGPGASVYVVEADNSITVYSVDANGNIVTSKPFPSSTTVTVPTTTPAPSPVPNPVPVVPAPAVTPAPVVPPTPQLKRTTPVVPTPQKSAAKASAMTIRETVTVHVPYRDPDSFHSRMLTPSEGSRLALSGR